MVRSTSFVLALAGSMLFSAQDMAQVPPAIAAPGETRVAMLHAEGAQIYECKLGADGKLAWLFREPIASLFLDGKTVGRHYAGPSWERIDGSAVVAKESGNVPGKTANDIAWLKLEVTSQRGSGALGGVTTVQRINTEGGVYAGFCDKAGALHSEPYAADYVFLKREERPRPRKKPLPRSSARTISRADDRLKQPNMLYLADFATTFRVTPTPSCHQRPRSKQRPRSMNRGE